MTELKVETEKAKVYPSAPDAEGYYFLNEENEENGKKARQYPSPENADGFYVDSAEDEALGIETKAYPNGKRVKKATLAGCKKVAIVRELMAKETKDIARFMQKDADNYQIAAVAVATNIGEDENSASKQTLEFYEFLKMKDYNKLLLMYQDLNF